MAEKLSIRIQAENAVKAGIKAVQRSFQRMRKQIVAGFKRIGNFARATSRAIVGIGGAIVGAAAVSIRAFAKQEQAERQLAAAFRANGEAVDALMPKYKALASAIQDETGVADEATIANLAQLRTLGVLETQLESAAKAVVALKSAGLEGATATRAVSAAFAGNFSMLTRYIPALRDANSEQEKAAIFAEFVAKGYKQQSDELATTAGRWEELKGRIGDALEEIGKTIVGGDDLAGVLANISNKIKELTTGGDVARWARDGVNELAKLNASIKKTGDFFRVLGAFFAGTESGMPIVGAWKKAVEIEEDRHKKRMANIEAEWKAKQEAIKREQGAIEEVAAKEDEVRKDRENQPSIEVDIVESITRRSQEMSFEAEKQKREQALQELAEEEKDLIAEVNKARKDGRRDDAIDAEKQLVALAEKELQVKERFREKAIGAARSTMVETPSEPVEVDSSGFDEEKKNQEELASFRDKAIAETADAQRKLAAANARLEKAEREKQIEELRKKEAKLVKDVAREKAERQREIHQNALDNINELAAENEELARKSIADFIKEAKAKEAIANQEKKDQEDIARIKRKVKIRGREGLAEDDLKKLEAAEAVEEAQAKAKLAAMFRMEAVQNMKEADKELEKLQRDQVTELKEIRKNINTLLALK